jgi:hypothetical protein
VYGWFYKEKAQHCPGEICDVKAKHDIQKISWVQIVIVLGFIALIVIMAYLFNEFFSLKPNLWDVFNSAPHK